MARAGLEESVGIVNEMAGGWAREGSGVPHQRTGHRSL